MLKVDTLIHQAFWLMFWLLRQYPRIVISQATCFGILKSPVTHATYELQRNSSYLSVMVKISKDLRIQMSVSTTHFSGSFSTVCIVITQLVCHTQYHRQIEYVILLGDR